MNEFEANDRLLTLSFSSLFMFGSGIKRPCGVSEADTRHVWLQCDNRFAEARDFCLLLFNQKFRHTTLRSFRDAIYANPNRMKAFETAINMPNLEEDLKKAEANPQGKEVRHLVHTFMPLLWTCHAAMPFSTLEQYAAMGKMNSMMLFFGPPSLFYTVAPNDIDNKSCLYVCRWVIAKPAFHCRRFRGGLKHYPRTLWPPHAFLSDKCALSWRFC